GVVGGDPEVAGTCKGEARAGGGAVDRGDDGLLELPDGEHRRVVVAAKAAGDVARRFLELVQVLADAEAAPGAGEGDGAGFWPPRFLERPDELAVHLG